MKHWLIGLGLAAIASTAMAQAMTSYQDAQGRFTIAVPKDWPVDPPQDVQPGVRLLLIGGADADCSVIAYDRPEWAQAKASDLVRTFQEPIKATDYAAGFSGVMQADGAKPPQAVRVETVEGWPVHLAEFTADGQAVLSANHYRPGLEVRMICKSYGAASAAEQFKPILTSFKTPRDGEWQAQVAQFAAAKAAAQEANKAAGEEAEKAEEKSQGKKKR